MKFKKTEKGKKIFNRLTLVESFFRYENPIEWTKQQQQRKTMYKWNNP